MLPGTTPNNAPSPFQFVPVKSTAFEARAPPFSVAFAQETPKANPLEPPKNPFGAPTFTATPFGGLEPKSNAPAHGFSFTSTAFTKETSKPPPTETLPFGAQDALPKRGPLIPSAYPKFASPQSPSEERKTKYSKTSAVDQMMEHAVGLVEKLKEMKDNEEGVLEKMEQMKNEEEKLKKKLQETEKSLTEAQQQLKYLHGENLEELTSDKLEQLKKYSQSTLRQIKQIEEERSKKERERLKRERECKVCFEKEIDTVLLPCGHTSLCSACAAPLKDCPICRLKIERIQKLFKA